MHMLVVPGAIFALIGLHLYLVVRLGVTSPPWSNEGAGRDRAEPAAPTGGAAASSGRRDAEGANGE